MLSAALALPVAAWAPSADAMPLHWPMPALPSLATVRSWLAGPGPAPRVPRQETGTAAGRPHQVPAAATRGVAKAAGRAPGKGPGELPPYTVHRPPAAHPYFTGPDAPDASVNFSPALSKLVPGAATATSDLYRNPGGSYTRVVYLVPVNYQDASGTWRPIDTSLVPGTGGRWHEHANSLAASFAVTADSPALASLGTGPGQQISLGLAGAAAVTGSAAGSSAAYAGVLPGTGLSATATRAGLSITLRLGAATAPGTWLFPLHLTGLTARLATGGTVQFVTAGGQVAAALARAALTDAKLSPVTGLPAASPDLAYRLISYQGGTALQVSADRTWLSGPARAFPVSATLNLSVPAAGGQATTQVMSGHVTVPAGSPVLPVGSPDRGQDTTAAVLTFPAIPPFPVFSRDQRVTSAALHVYGTAAGACPPGPLQISALSRAAAAGAGGQPAAGSGNWTAGGRLSVGFCGQTAPVPAAPPVPLPATGASPAATASASPVAAGSPAPAATPGPAGAAAAAPSAAQPATEPAGAWLTAAVPVSTVGQSAAGTTVAVSTPAVVSAAASGKHPAGALTAAAGGWQLLASPSTTTTPFLAVTASSGTPQIDAQYPPNGYNSTTLTPQLLAKGHDPDGQSVKFTFTIYDSSGNQLATSGLITDNDWTVPAGKLAWNGSYFWTVTDNDGTNTSPPQTAYLSTPVPQPLITSSLSQNAGAGYSPAAGNYTTTATDAQVDVAGPPLMIDRYYNSLDPRVTGAFGTAWSSVLDMKIAPGLTDSTGAVQTMVVTYPDGQEVAFGKNSSGTYTAPLGRYATLTAVTGGGFTLTDKNDTLYTFGQSLGNGAYGITSITDALKNVLNFAYNGSNQITQISSVASSRALYITWATPTGATAAHVASVATDPVIAGNNSTALTWGYSYSGDQLTSVCPPASTTVCTTYAYQTGSDFQNAVLDTGPHSYWRLDEASGTAAASSVLLNEGADNGTYANVTLGQPGPLPGSPATAAGFNGTTSYVGFPSSLVTGGSYQSVSVWFKTTGTNEVLFGTSTDPVTSATTTSSYTPSLYIGSSGDLHAEFQTSVTTTIATTSPVNDGKWHLAVLAASGESQTLYLDGNQVGSPLTGALSIPNAQTSAYIGSGFLGGTWPDESHSGSGSTGYASFFNGSISDVALWDRPVTGSEVKQMWAAAQSPASLVTTVTRPSGSVYAQVSYNGATSTVSQVTDENGGTWQLQPATVTGSSQVYVSSVLGQNPIDYWRLIDTGTTQAVNQVKGGTANYNNVTEGNVTGPFEYNTDSFNGTSSYVALPTGMIDNTGGQSVSLWFKAASGVNGILFGYQSQPITQGTASSYYTPALYVGTDGKLYAEFWNGSVDPVSASGTVDDGQWHNVVLSAGSNTQTLYLDGAKAATLSGTISNNGSQQYEYLGVGITGNSWPNEPFSGMSKNISYFTGSIAETAFYNSQLSAAQVSEEYSAARSSSGPAPAQTEKVTDPGGKTITYVMDPQNGDRIVSETDGLGNTTKYGYDTGGFLYSTTDPDGDVTLTGHDVRGNQVSETSCQNQAASICTNTYYSYYPDDTSTNLSPDPRNDMLVAERGPGSSSATDSTYLTSYSYDSAGNLTSITTPQVPGFPNGRTTATTYTTTATPAFGTGTTPAGLPATVTSPGGAVTSTLYYSNGDVAQVTDPDGMVTKYTYDNIGRVLTKTEVSDSYPNGLTTTYVYNANGQVITQTDSPVTNRVTGAVHTAQTSTVYNADGEVTSQTVADTTGGDASRTVSSIYNSHDQVTSTTDASGAVTSSTYDAYGNRASDTDAAGNVTAYTYDPNGHLLTTTLQNYTGSPSGSQAAAPLMEESRAYDPAGRLASVTDSMGWVTAYTYTDNGLTATVVRSDPHTGASFTEQANTYDNADELTQQVTSNGATTTGWTVDAAGRTTSETVDPAGLGRVTTFTYSPDDQVTNETLTAQGSTTPVQSTSYSYDHMGNQTSESEYVTGGGNPDGWWRLDQTSGTSVPDASGIGNDGTATNVTWANGAGTFNGTSSQIVTQSPALDTTGSFSVSAWANLSSTANAASVVSQPASLNDAYRLQYSKTDGAWSFSRWSDNTSTATRITAHGSTAPQLNTWTHLVATYDATTGKMILYVNGAQVGTATDTTPFAAPGGVVIGRDLFGGSPANWFPGSISDVQVYQRVLSAAQVQTVYSQGRDGNGLATNKLTTSWTLDQRGLPTSMTDPNGNKTSYSYDEAGQLAVTTQPAVSTQVYGGTVTQATPVTMTGYDTFGQPVETSDANGNVTTTAYDAENRPLTETKPPYTPPGSSTAIHAVTTRVYNGLGELTSQTDPLGNKTSYSYDQLGNLTSETAPDTGVTSYSYDTEGDRLSETGPTGAVTSATYDYLGNQLTSTQVDRYTGSNYNTTASYTTSDSYNSNGWLASETSPAGVVTSYGYDAAGEKTSETDAASNKTQYGYDTAGRLISTTNPDGTKSTVSYDEAGRQVGQADYSATNTLLRSSSASYDGNGNMLSSTDYRGNTTTFTYDPTGVVASETQPVTGTSSITTSFSYDLMGNRTLYTDGNGHQWWSTYNSWNMPESQIEPATSAFPNASQGTFTAAYDAGGNLTSISEPGGATITDTYNSMNWLSGQSGSGAEAATATRSYTYDHAGNMLTAATGAAGSAPATSESFTYNDRGQPITASGSGGSASLSYNGDGQVTSVADAAGTTSYTYDNVGRLATLANPLTGTTATYSYNPMSQVSQISNGTGNDVRTFGYDSLHRLNADTLKTAGGATVASIGYVYDANGNMTSKTTTGFAGAGTSTYTYDYANRLTSWNNGTATTSYGYDKAGNLTQIGSETLSYDQRDQLASTTSGGTTTPYSFTARGTMASAGAVNYTSDAYGQTITAGGQTYGYDANGRMLTASGSAGPFTFTYAGPGSQVASDGTWNYSYDPGGGLAAIGPTGGTTAQGTIAYTDNHTNVTGDFAPAGTALAGSANYDPFGNVTASSALAGHLGYQSDFTDPATSQVHMGARWYSPANGQFTSKDSVNVNPVPNPAAANPFAYAADNPLTGIDPTGHMMVGGGGGGYYHPRVVYHPRPHPAPSCGGWFGCAWHAATGWWHRTVVNPYHRFTRTVSPSISALFHHPSWGNLWRAGVTTLRAGRQFLHSVKTGILDAAAAGIHAGYNAVRAAISNGLRHWNAFTKWAAPNHPRVAPRYVATARSPGGRPRGTNPAWCAGSVASRLAGCPNQPSAHRAPPKSTSHSSPPPTMTKLPACNGPMESRLVGSCTLSQPNLKNARGPDYYSLGLSACFIVCVGVQFTVDRYGRSYMTDQIGVGPDLSLGPSIGAGTILTKNGKAPTRGALSDYLTGNGASVCGQGGIAGGCVTHGTGDITDHAANGTDIYIGSPGLGVVTWYSDTAMLTSGPLHEHCWRKYACA